jgi:hypothetical protein
MNNITKGEIITIIIISLIILVLSLCGCSSVTFTKPDGTMIKYERFGNQEIGSFYMEPDGSVAFDKQKSDNETLYQAINKLVDKIP